MPTNEFEKRVQDKLEQFELNPDAAVWQNVEKEIREKKRRRMIFILLPLLLLFILISTYYFSGRNDNNNKIATNGISQKHQAKEPALRSHKPASSSDSVGANQPQALSIPVKEGAHARQKPTRNSAIIDQSGVLLKPTKRTHQAKDIASTYSITFESKDVVKKRRMKATTEPSTQIETSQPNKIDRANEKQEKSGTGNTVITEVETGAKATSAPPINIDKAKTSVDSAMLVNNDIASKPLVDSAKSQPAHQPALAKHPTKTDSRWSFDLAIGISSVKDHIFSMDKSAYSQVFLSTPGSTGAGPVANPSDIKPSLMLKAGLSRRWDLTKRSSVSLGLHYRYASFVLHVGSVTDTIAQGQAGTNLADLQRFTIYSGPQTRRQTNRFHFISIPVEYHWRINRNIPLEWEIQASVDYLLSTNALVYTSAYGGVYYHNRAAFNKLHLSLGTGLSYHFSTKNKMELAIGPELSFDTRQLMKDGNQRQYLLSTGIKARFLLPKKNHR